ncbi:thioredoxin domain-containing protein 6 isoform X3 [Phoca vitulina]|uniref:thioredoxin domain-containing protein 6 isoform X3 n=1 Tax=Phoca vitulina TaxID=9720 RepID=UPI00139610BA|nr:thioredoxin domain-containing protein 6 isoform X3 [Phoca vitulina]
MPEGLHRRAPPLHAGKGLCRKPPGEPRPCGRQAPLPTPHPVVFILHRGIYFAATYVYLKGTGALSEGGSGFAGFRSGLSPGCCWEQSEPEVTGLLSSLQSHGKQEEGNCPAVVDVYQGWCGPCKPVVSLFQKMRMEVGLDLLHFALAEADCLDVLEKYRGRCEPNFLFYAGGELVAVVRGANAPLLQKTIREQLEAEKKVLAEGRKRKVIHEAGFDILANEERTMTEAEMQLFYQHKAGEVSSSASTCPTHSHFFLFLQHYVYRLMLVWEKIEYYEEQEHEQQEGREFALRIMIIVCIK